MTTCAMRRCDNPVADAAVCSSCATKLAEQLGDVAWVERELEVTRSRQARIASGGRPSTGADHVSLPFDVRVAPAIASVHAELAQAVLALTVDADPPPGPTCVRCEHLSCSAIRSRRRPADTLTAMAAWLLARTEPLRHHPDAPALMTTLRGSIGRAKAVLDRPRDVLYAGPCPAPVGDPIVDDCPCPCHAGPFAKCSIEGGCWSQHEQPTCGADLYVDAPRTPDRKPARAPKPEVVELRTMTVQCPQCNAVHDVTALRAQLLAYAEDVLATATEIARFLSAHRGGKPVTPELLWKWHERGRITERGVDRRGRPTFRVGDVLDVLAGDEARTAPARDTTAAS